MHTSSHLIKIFDTLLTEIAPDISAEHIVQEDLLKTALKNGEMNPRLGVQIQATVLETARHGAKVILCTCSTLGTWVETVASLTETTILRIDRPMAEQAIATGRRVVVVATLHSTLIPTRDLLLTVAQEKNKKIQIIELLCDSAWDQFEQGNLEEYWQEIAAHLQKVADQGDVIVLAQASIAPVVELCPDFPIPIISNAQSGLEAAIKAYRTQR